MSREPCVVEVDDIRETAITQLVFEPDQEKAALSVRFGFRHLQHNSHRAARRRQHDRA